MPISMDTTLGEILDNPDMLAIMEEMSPGVSKNPMIKMAKGFTLGKLVKTPAAKMPEAQIQGFIDSVNAKGL
jgi:hypothetical protein